MCILKSLSTIKAVVLLTLLNQSQSYAESRATEKTLTLAATKWCPFICDSTNEKGFITDYLTALLAQYDIALKVDILPWSRAIILANNGTYDGLLTATHEEAPLLMFPTTPTGTYQMCFFSSTLSNFTYNGRTSLAGKRIGIIKDYSYGEPLDSILASPKTNEHFITLASTSPLTQLVSMSERGRIDLFVEDKMVMSRFDKAKSISPVNLLDCFDEIPFYTAISPNSKRSTQWIDSLEQAFNSPQAPIIYEQMKRNYE